MSQCFLDRNACFANGLQALLYIAFEAAADQFANGGWCFCGQFPEIDFRAQRAELWVDGRRVKAVTGAHPYGNPARLLPWARTHAASRGGLEAGDLVTTGSWTGMDFVRRGAEVRAVFPGVGEAVVQL